MNKKLIALGVAAALAAPLAAQAGVTVYGQARVSVDYDSNSDTSSSTLAGACGTTSCESNVLGVNSDKSRLGVKGDEDLGGGLKAIYQVEAGVSMDNGTFVDQENYYSSTPSHLRDTFLGLASNYGTVLAGRHITPYRMATEGMDPFKDTKADFNALVGSIGGKILFNNRANNVLAYVSPNMSGFQVAAAYIANYNDIVTALGGSSSTNSDNLPMTKVQKDRTAYSLSATYNNGPLFLAAAYETLNKLATLNPATGNKGNGKAYKVAGGWDFGQGTKVGLLFEDIKDVKLGSIGTGPGAMDFGTGKRNAWYVDASHKMGKNSVMAAVGVADKLGGISKSGATYYALGARHDFTDHTNIYAVYAKMANDTNGTYGLELVPDAVKGKDVSSFSVGVNHKF